MPVESPLRGRDDHHFGLIETLRYQPGEGCVRARRHVARMAASASHFGRVFDEMHARNLLAEVTGELPLRLRLHLDEKDKLSLGRHPFVPVAEGTIWRIAIAGSVRLDPQKPASSPQDIAARPL